MKRTNGFTLVELVVVVLILGILAAIAAPKIINNADEATASSGATTLTAIRDAIELYRAKNKGDFPGGKGTTSESGFKTAIDPYLRGSQFPKAVPDKDQTTPVLDAINIVTAGTPLSADGASGTKGWKYDSASGEIIINSDDPVPGNPGLNYDDL